MTSLIHDCIYKKLFSVLPALIKNQDKVLLYPMGGLTKELVKKGVFRGCNLLGVADKAATKHVDEDLNLTVYNRQSIAELKPDVIFICSLSFHNEIMVDLLAFCIEREIELIDLCEALPAQEERKVATYIGKINALRCVSEIRALLSAEKYQDSRRLEPFGYKCYSQHDEDGMLAETVRRLGPDFPRTFVEFGVGDGMENNSLWLLKQGWKGLWIEGSNVNAQHIRREFSALIEQKQLAFEHQFIDRDNINQLIAPHFQGDIGMLCIDIDGNDYYVWANIEVVQPWVVIIEYNGKFPPPVQWSIEYHPQHVWTLTDYQGASLAALAELGKQKGYQLVGCNLNGTNAFFVRTDKLNDQFLISDDLHEYYHPVRHFLTDGYRLMTEHVPDPRMGTILK